MLDKLRSEFQAWQGRQYDTAKQVEKSVKAAMGQGAQWTAAYAAALFGPVIAAELSAGALAIFARVPMVTTAVIEIFEEAFGKGKHVAEVVVEQNGQVWWWWEVSEKWLGGLVHTEQKAHSRIQLSELYVLTVNLAHTLRMNRSTP